MQKNIGTYLTKFLLAAVVLALGVLSITYVAYAAGPTVSSAKVTGVNMVTVVYSEPVNSAISDYSAFTGSLMNRNITALSGSGTNTISLTFDGNNFTTDASGGMTIASTVFGLNDSTPFSATAINVTDGQAPLIVSSSISTNSPNPNSTVAHLGDTITLSFSASETVYNPAVTIDGHTVTPNGSGNGPYTVAYVLSGSDSAGSVSFTINLVDAANNSGTPVSGSLSFNGNSGVNTNINTPQPAIYETTSVPSIVNNAVPNYAFNSNTAGTISYTGDCVSMTTNAYVGSNNITFNPLTNGLHNNCSLKVTDASGRVSNQLNISPFTVNVVLNAPSGTESSPASAPAPAPTPAPLNDGFKFTRLLSLGSLGTDVRELQKRLAAEGFFNGPTNGRFGPLTQAAVKAYQIKHGLTPLGIVGPGTRAALNAQ